MATGRNEGLDYPFKAARDLSANQYFGMKASANDTADLTSATTSVLLGVLQNKPAAASRAAVVRIMGQSKIMCGGTVAAGNHIAAVASGYFVACLSGSAPCGLAIKGANSGYVGEAIIVPNYLLSATSAATNQG